MIIYDLFRMYLHGLLLGKSITCRENITRFMPCFDQSPVFWLCAMAFSPKVLISSGVFRAEPKYDAGDSVIEKFSNGIQSGPEFEYVRFLRML